MADDVIAAPPAGRLRGARDGPALRFLGVPYAQPPAVSGRFAAPVPHPAWDGVRDARSYGASSAQPDRGVTIIPEPIIPSLQAVIQDARAVALQLRPPRMQEAGLLATLNSLWVDSRALDPSLVIEPRALVNERDIPDGLKPVILRIAQMTLDFAAQDPSARHVAWVLGRSGQELQLSVDMAVDAHVSPRQSSQQPSPSAAALNPLEAIRARVSLSGGSSECVRNAAGRGTIVCSWKS